MRIWMLHAAYQQPVKYNLAVAREVLKHVYTAERLQPPTSLGAMFGTYSTLWARARSLGYWREVVRNGEYARLGVYALEAYGIFNVRLPFFFPFPLASAPVSWCRSGLNAHWQIGEILGRRSLVGYNIQ
jgi:F-type H+-transporting ATPase subunit g